MRRNGLKVKLQEKPFEIMAILLQQAGEVVSREDLHKRLWPADTFVDFDHGLNNAINKLRFALGDSAQNPRFIATLGRRGYRFIAPVAALGQEPPPTVIEPEPGAADRAANPLGPRKPSWASRRFWVALLVVLFGVFLTWDAAQWIRLRKHGSANARVQSIAVLPLQNLSNTPAEEYFADGMTDELITELASIGSIRVVSRTSVMQYRSARKALPQIGHELGVDAVVEGSIAHSGDHVRINAQLIETATDRHLWAKTYDRDMRDVLAMQSEVAQAIASAVQIELTPGERARFSKDAGATSNPAAHRLYLLGRYHWGRWSADDMAKAISYFQQAIASDPAYAPAWSGLAAAYAAQGGEPGLNRARDVMPKAREAALKALAIDDQLAEAHSGLASVKLFYDWDGKGFEKEIRRAIDLNPNYADAHGLYAAYFDAIGKAENARRERKRALELDPLNPFVNMAVGIPLYYERRYSEAAEWPLKAIDLDPSFAEGHNLLGSIYYKQRRYDQWLSETARERDIIGVKPESTKALLTAYRSAGLPGYWREELKQSRIREQSGSVSPMDMARIHLELGEMDRAFGYLEKACDERVNWVIYVEVNPLYERLRGDRRLEQIVKRIGLKN